MAAESEKSVPVPPSDTLCGLVAALSVIVSDAIRVPLAVGLKVTVIVQFVPAARGAGVCGHVLV